MSRLFALTLSLLSLGLLTSRDVPAQGTKPPAGAPAQPAAAAKPAPAGPAKPGAASVKINEQVRPAFIIDPIVNRLEARRGKTLALEWGITCEGAPSTLEIRTVALTQDENGTIFPNENVPAPKDLELLTPGTVKLGAQEKFVIRGRLRVPDTLSTFHTYGIVVRDAGQLKAKVNPAQPDGPRVGIKFVTQYLLRCDVSVQGVRAESTGKLKIESGELVEVDGVPIARIYVQNPTDGPIEFGARMQIRLTQESDDKPTFALGMPVRSNMDPPEKHIGRILAGTRIKMESPLATPVFPGQYFMEASILGDSRVFTESGFPIVVAEGDFPAQGLASVQAAPGLIASPSQIELSLQRGGSRAEVLTFQNDTLVPTEVEIVAETLTGQPIEAIGVRPNKITLVPGASRKVSVTLTASGDQNAHRYARLRIKSTPAGGAAVESTPIVLAVLGRSDSPAKLEGGELVWDAEHGTPCFVIDVKNAGERHMPAEGVLTLGDESGRPIDIRGGFGKWVLPGTSERIRFKPPHTLPNGKYSARLRIATGENPDPIEKRLEFDYTGTQP